MLFEKVMINLAGPVALMVIILLIGGIGYRVGRLERASRYGGQRLNPYESARAKRAERVMFGSSFLVMTAYLVGLWFAL